MILRILLCSLSFISTIQARGPHHPRGEPISKHHVHYRPTKGTGEQKLTQDKQLLHDTEHLQEHLEDIINEPDLSALSDEELEFYYFQVHDVDKNSKLDGLEILQAIQHTMHKDESESNESTENDEDTFNYYVELIDKVLAEDDLDNDGFLTYPEYVAGRKKEIVQMQPSVQMIQ
ncbi:PREDICTED: multiple coagulation factor deficiency protein 2 homolog [Nicrophorus vespilloides]|uniref:Multiple coagulation factor deficiency protein 2 homolog n=1 Tax=Nicrophorus vespilloides TaxID=110193 RepID=A0ABM1MM16_NICVS|nr:PREDICTED: multiple coagulation factor deficiency protein 2 homolog [Nicrophorus vespilloides]